MDLNICEPIGHGFRFGEGIDFFKERIRCVPDASAGFKAIAQDNIAFLDSQLLNNEYLTGSKMTLVDVHLFCFLDFGRNRGQPLSDEFTPCRSLDRSYGGATKCRCVGLRGFLNI